MEDLLGLKVLWEWWHHIQFKFERSTSGYWTGNSESGVGRKATGHSLPVLAQNVRSSRDCTRGQGGGVACELWNGKICYTEIWRQS